MSATATCPICLHRLDSQPLGEKNGYVLIGCRTCGSVMTQKPVTPQEREQYLAEIEPQITHVPNPQAEIEAIKKMIAKVMPDGKGKRFLDINCRNGYAVMAAQQLGFEARGIDSHPFFIEFAQNKYSPDFFELADIYEAADAGIEADLIYVREGFGDQYDLEAYTKALAAIIAPGGIVYIEEPDANDFNTPRYFPGWSYVFPPLNFRYLSRSGLYGLLKRHGLKVERKFWCWAPLLRLIVSRK